MKTYEDRITNLETRVRLLEQALQAKESQAIRPQPPFRLRVTPDAICRAPEGHANWCVIGLPDFRARAEPDAVVRLHECNCGAREFVPTSNPTHTK